MSSRCDYFFRQRVTESELDLGFELLTSTDLGWFAKTVKPTTRREKWSTTDATHQQKGHCCGTAHGSQGTQ